MNTVSTVGPFEAAVRRNYRALEKFGEQYVEKFCAVSTKTPIRCIDITYHAHGAQAVDVTFFLVNFNCAPRPLWVVKDYSIMGTRYYLDGIFAADGTSIEPTFTTLAAAISFAKYQRKLAAQWRATK